MFTVLVEIDFPCEDREKWILISITSVVQYTTDLEWIHVGDG